MLHNKDEALNAFKVFKAKVEKQCDKKIKIVRTDRGGEYYGRYTKGRQALVHLLSSFKTMGSLPNTLCLVLQTIMV